jgi:SAM-dependent methyltransferase
MELSEAAILHRNVPPDWYRRGIKENWAQKIWHTLRFANLGRLINRTEGKVLDVGSADGTMTEFILRQTGADLVIGVEALASSVDYAQKRFSRNKKLQFFQVDAERLPFKRGEFDMVYCMDTIEHFLDPEKALKEMRRVLKKDGQLVILVHTNSLLFRTLWLVWENSRGWIWKGTHISDFSRNELEKLIKKAGFQIRSIDRFMLGMYRLLKAEKK